MKQAKRFFLLIAIIIVASCKPSAQQTAADAEQPTGSTVAVTNAASVLSTVAAHDSATVYGHISQLHLTPGHYRLSKEVGGEILSNGFYID